MKGSSSGIRSTCIRVQGRPEQGRTHGRAAAGGRRSRGGRSRGGSRIFFLIHGRQKILIHTIWGTEEMKEKER